MYDKDGLVHLKQYKVKKFSHEAKENNVTDRLLSETLNHFLAMERNGQQKLSMGAGLYKLRLAAKEGRGKSGGARSILAFKHDSRVMWLHLFSKNEKDNVSITELKKLKLLSNILLETTDDKIVKLIALGELCEVKEYD
jgi:hypothetical protein